MNILQFRIVSLLFGHVGVDLVFNRASFVLFGLSCKYLCCFVLLCAIVSSALYHTPFSHNNAFGYICTYHSHTVFSFLDVNNFYSIL